MRIRLGGRALQPRKVLGAATVTLAIMALAASIPNSSFAFQAPSQETELRPVRLPAPPFTALLAVAGSRPAPSTRLARLSERRNAITDTDRWFADNRLQWPAVEARRMRAVDRSSLPPGIALEHAGAELWRVIHDPPLELAIYSGRYVAGYDPAAGRYRFAYDFGAYITPPAFTVQDREFVAETVEWASAENGVLYVSNFHRTYARSSKGSNAYLTAIDLATHRMLWRSQPLVANANNFVVVGEVLVSGYGFTAEPDYLYVVDKRTGAILQRLAVKSGPEHLIRGRDRMFVRTYDTDYILRIVSR
jgi:hypothetical protein